MPGKKANKNNFVRILQIVIDFIVIYVSARHIIADHYGAHWYSYAILMLMPLISMNIQFVLTPELNGKARTYMVMAYAGVFLGENLLYWANADEQISGVLLFIMMFVATLSGVIIALTIGDTESYSKSSGNTSLQLVWEFILTYFLWETLEPKNWLRGWGPVLIPVGIMVLTIYIHSRKRWEILDAVVAIGLGILICAGLITMQKLTQMPKFETYAMCSFLGYVAMLTFLGFERGQRGD